MADAGQLHRRTPIFGKVPEQLLHDLSITDGAARQYAHMHWRYGKNKQNWESQKSMAAYMGVSEGIVSNRIRELEAKDWVVVVLRGRAAKGRFQTPYYHVFEDRADCRRFRQEYQCVEGDVMRPKVEKTKGRKSRKGVGGNPKLSHTVPTPVQTVTVPTPVQMVNGDHRLNLSSDKLDSVSIQTQKAASIDSVGANPTTWVEPAAPSKEKGKTFTVPECDAIIDAWHETNDTLRGVKGHLESERRNLTFRGYAQEILAAGCTAEDVRRYMRAEYKRSFWADKQPISLFHLQKHLPAWCKANPNGAHYHNPFPPDENPEIEARIVAAQKAAYEQYKADIALMEQESVEPIRPEDREKFGIHIHTPELPHWRKPL